MKHLPMLMVLVAAMTSNAAAQPYRPFDTSQLKGPQAGPPNELLVLGSPHLSRMPPAFQIEQLDPELDKLAAWHTTAIAIEALSGAQCDAMRRYPARYRESVETYCWDSAPAAATGLDVPAATAAWGRRLADWPATPTSAARRGLAALFLPEERARPPWSSGCASRTRNATPATVSTRRWSTG